MIRAECFQREREELLNFPYLGTFRNQVFVLGDGDEYKNLTFFIKYWQ